MKFTVYEMKTDIANIDGNIGIRCVPFEKRYFEQYKQIYNECFFDMRKSLDIKPYNFLSDYTQIQEKAKDIFLLIDESGLIIGSVACYGNEIDDLFVNKRFQGRGFGRKLLLWGINHIRAKSFAPIYLHVAEWNKRAVTLYKSVGFTVSKREIITIQI